MALDLTVHLVGHSGLKLLVSGEICNFSKSKRLEYFGEYFISFTTSITSVSVSLTSTHMRAESCRHRLKQCASQWTWSAPGSSDFMQVASPQRQPHMLAAPSYRAANLKSALFVRQALFLRSSQRFCIPLNFHENPWNFMFYGILTYFVIYETSWYAMINQHTTGKYLWNDYTSDTFIWQNMYRPYRSSILQYIYHGKEK